MPGDAKDPYPDPGFSLARANNELAEAMTHLGNAIFRLAHVADDFRRALDKIGAADHQDDAAATSEVRSTTMDVDGQGQLPGQCGN